MNIQEAKEEIRHTLQAYLARDKSGGYAYPRRQQRPMLLMGPPGIGKTAVMEQIAAECGVGLVSYTMTHHTRQSAVGLPRLVEKEYHGRRTTVTEYTMSEIIASVYDCMEQTGCREGILFIDEINCVSETLSPVMLQFLQNKRFGMHEVPEGWVIVAAGNPPEYNRSAKEFDIVTMDRVRRMDIEADLEVWQQYAAQRGVHEAVRSFLQLYPDRFYQASSSAVSRTFVTARGWEDLSALIFGYEKLKIEVGPEQIAEFLGEKKTAGEFASYYRIWTKYGEDYHVQDLLEGTCSEEERDRKSVV